MTKNAFNKKKTKSDIYAFMQELIQEILQEDKIKGADGKVCWKGYRYAGTENGKDKCVKVNEENNPKDVISVDVPLMIRLLEYAREDAQTDMDLHNVAEKLIELSASGEVLSMSHYNEIVADKAS